jgi:hypothetical protein
VRILADEALWHPPVPALLPVDIILEKRVINVSLASRCWFLGSSLLLQVAELQRASTRIRTGDLLITNQFGGQLLDNSSTNSGGPREIRIVAQRASRRATCKRFVGQIDAILRISVRICHVSGSASWLKLATASPQLDNRLMRAVADHGSGPYR